MSGLRALLGQPRGGERDRNPIPPDQPDDGKCLANADGVAAGDYPQIPPPASPATAPAFAGTGLI
ncbi:MAG TPA: hypothetical protein VN627_13770 [Novosphingobium sp.]|nr:hypothetical protein [Novosphingobium sp.]